MKPPSVEPLGNHSTVIRIEDDPQAYMREVHDIAAVSLAGERDKHIKTLAKRKNMRVSDVRKDVDNQRSEFAQQKTTEDLEPWSTPVNGEQLLMDIFDCVGEYTWFGNNDMANQKRLTVALWVIFSHCFEAFHVAPILAIQSPTKRCGKNTLLDPLTEMVKQGEMAANMSSAALFRSIAKWRPTLVIDEVDRFLRLDQEFVGMINSGHTANGTVTRCVGDNANMDVERFTVWCPKVLAGIGALPDTVQDRSIVIELRRKPMSVQVKRFRLDRVHHLHELARMGMRWSLDNSNALRLIEPNMPAGLNDRAEDNWRPLMAIAEHIGGDLPDVVRAAAQAISASTPDTQDTGEILISDLRKVFRHNPDWLQTKDILRELHDMEDRPWSTWSKGNPMTPHKLANQLKRFGLKSRRHQEHGTQLRLRGYCLSDLEPVWQQYEVVK